PREAGRLDRSNRKPLLDAGIDLLPQPEKIIELLCDLFPGILADNDARNIQDVGPERVDMTMSLDEDFDVERPQLLQAFDPMPAVDVRIRCREELSHEGIPREQDLRFGVPEDHVIRAVSRRRKDEELSAFDGEAVAENLEWRNERRRLTDQEAPHEGEDGGRLKLANRLGTRLDDRPGPSSDVVEVSDVL